MEREKKDIQISDLIYKYLTDSLKGNEAEILEAWQQQPENRKLLLELKNSEHLYQGLSELHYTDTEPVWQMLEQQIRLRRRIRMRRWWIGIAAGLLLLLGGIWWSLQQAEEQPLPSLAQQTLQREDAPITLRKANGEILYFEDSVQTLLLPQEIRQEQNVSTSSSTPTIEPQSIYNELVTSSRNTIEVSLYDGTRVWLNAGSKLRYPTSFTAEKRQVSLEGEGYFEVVRDERRPFIVSTASATIRVLGIGFNVSAPDSLSCTTTLVEGRVQIEDGQTNRILLSPGQQARLHTDGNWDVRQVDIRYYTAWKNNLFAFEDTSLREILNTLSSWYGVTFLFRQAELADLTYTTMIKRYDKVQQVLHILEEVGDFRCERIDDTHFMIKKK